MDEKVLSIVKEEIEAKIVCFRLELKGFFTGVTRCFGNNVNINEY